MRRTPLLTLLSLLLAVGAVAVTGPSRAVAAPTNREILAQVDDYLADYRQRHGMPGVAVAVTLGPGVVHVTAQGHQSDGTPLRADSPMWIGSVSKTFTAFSVLQLVQEGRVELDQPVTHYVEDFTLADPRAARITVRDVLTHRSGIPSPTLIAPTESLEESVRQLRGWTLYTNPGGRYRYANANFQVAALLVARVTGQPFEQERRERLFRPLGMTDTRSAPTSISARTCPKAT